MKRIWSVVTLTIGAVLLTGCPPLPGAFDLSDLPDGVYDEPYEGQLAIADYDGPVSFALIGTGFPAGLEMNEVGAVSGTAESAGVHRFTVLASDMKRIEDFQGEVTIYIEAPAEAFLGYEHDQLTNMTERFDLQRDIWVRVAGTGKSVMSEYQIDLGIYLPGDNGVPERGMSDGLAACNLGCDDVRIGDVSFADVEVSFGSWEPTIEEDIFPPDYPSQHIPEDDPPSVGSDGLVTAGADAGDASLTIEHNLLGEVETRVMVVPPDWCPLGEHVDGGNSDGFCQ